MNTSDIYPSSDLVQDRDWDVWQPRCKLSSGSGQGWSLVAEASKLTSSAVDTVSAVSSHQACLRRCRDMQGCKLFGFSSSGYTNCQLSRMGYTQLARADMTKDAKWDLFELRSHSGGGVGGGGVYFPNNNQAPCYDKVKTGYRHYSGYYQQHLNVRNEEECKEECSRAPSCSSFSYRSASQFNPIF